ncbi:MAG TPA: invasion associated locus B family protein [Devosiaceae bacterium]|nr:invasion associated locus B family protein [Devosiaceae bacterium]
MTLKNYVVAGLLAAALSATAFATGALAAGKPAAAQPAPAATTAAPQSSTAGLPQDKGSANRPSAQNWLKVCDPIPSGQKAAGQKACILRQVVVANNQFLGSFLLRDDPGQESRLLAVAAVPLGVLLPFGLTWQIDGQKPIRVPYMLCDPQSCASQLVINEQYVAALKKGQTLSLIAKNRANKDLVVNINLGGFGQVYDGQAAMTFDEFRKDQTGGAALEQQLQDRAEQLRKQLDSGSTPASGSAPAAAPAQ